MSRTRATVAAGVATALLGAFLALAIASPAEAHSQVIGSDPADGSTITTLPDEISVTANEDLADLTGTGQGFALFLVGADGTKYQTTPISIDGPRVSAPTPADLPAGEYKLLYQIVSADTHPVAGSIQFTYDPHGTPVAGDATPTSQPVGVDDGLTAGGRPGADPSSTEAAAAPPSAGVQLAAWLVPLAIVVLIGIIVLVVLAVRRRKG